jgi:hypothetical protein
VVLLDNIQLLPALKVNIIIVHPWDVVFPRESNTPRVNNYEAQGKTTSQGGTIMMFALSASNNCILLSTRSKGILISQKYMVLITK